MSKMYFHIGLHKTATTFLQEQFFPQLENTTYVDRKTIHALDGWNKMMMADDSLYDEEEARQEAGQWKGDQVLVSTESLSGKPLFFHVINRTLIAKRLHSIFPDATIILFIRGQEGLLLSHYNQYVKSRDDGYRRINEFIWFPGKAEIDTSFFGKPQKLAKGYFNTSNFQVHLDTFKHFELIELYKSLFKNVYVFLFEDLIARPEETLTKLANITGDNTPKIKNLGKTKSNMSLDDEALYRKRLLNRLRIIVDNKVVIKLYQKVLKILPMNEENIDQKYVSHIAREYYRENNRKIIEKFPEIGIQHYTEAYKF
ncbi:MAG: hypothetical protein AAF502_04295 [Bacteroidota bacterium]